MNFLRKMGDREEKRKGGKATAMWFYRVRNFQARKYLVSAEFDQI